MRNLRRAPAFTGLVVLTLALGIGATTAMFSVVDAVLLNPLPFPNSDRFAELATATEGRVATPRTTNAVVHAMRRETNVFTAVEAYNFGSADITGGGDPEIVAAPVVTPGLLTVLGVAPALGRLFTDDDVAIGRVVLLSHHLWSARYGSDPEIVGKEIIVDDQPHRVIGVMPSTFRFPEGRVRLWRPYDISLTAKPMRLGAIAVRRPELTDAQVKDRLKALSPELRASAVLGPAETLTTDALLQARFGRQMGQALYILFGAVSLVLLVACVNVMNLLLVRASGRAGELALMTALGASTGGLVRGVLIESVLLAAAGCVAGLALARGLLSLILAAAPPNLTFLTIAVSELNWRALAFAAAVALVTCVVFGVLPAWRAGRVDAIEVLKQRAQSVNARDDWWQGALVAAQLALVVVLLAGSGLLLRSFGRLLSVDPGFEVDRLAVLELQLPANRYGSPGAGLAFMEEIERRLESRAGVVASVSGGVPPSGGGFSFNLTPEAEGGMPVDFTDITLPFGTVRPDYFDAMGIPIVAGRSFTADDGADVVIVNDVLARRFWGEASPIGRRFRVDVKRPWQTVVGVAADVKQMGPAEPMGEGMEFYQLLPRTGRNGGFFALVIRTAGDRQAVLDAARQHVWEVDPKLPIGEVATMEERIGEAIARPRFFLTLSSAFAVTGALLAAVGVYGISAYWVSRRKRELAIRIALGASGEKVMGLVIRRSLKLALAGTIAGLALAVAGTRLIESMLFQTSGRDPVTLVAVTLFLAVLVVIGGLVPAIRAARVDPMSTLRAE